jgi:DNA-binding NtrC family response regulator
VLVADLSEAAGSEAVLQAALAAPSRPRVYALVDAERLDDAVAAIARGADDFLWRPVSEERVTQLWVAAAETRRRDEEAEETAASSPAPSCATPCRGARRAGSRRSPRSSEPPPPTHRFY